jgi:hypothetical protein
MSVSTLSKSKIESLLRFVCEKNGIDPEKENEQFSRLSNIPLPFDGVKRTGCCALKLNHGLFTQCCDKTTEESDICKTCERGDARYGKIDERISNNEFPYVDPRGKKEIRFGNVMEKLGISREDALAAALQRKITIPEESFEVTKGTRGRPKKNATEDVDSSDDEKPKKKRGRPRKEERVVKHEDTSDLVSELVATKKKEVSDELTETVQEIGGSDACDKNGLMATIHEHVHGENASNVPIAWKELDSNETGVNIDKEYNQMKQDVVTEPVNENAVEPVVKKETKEAKEAKKEAKEAEKLAKKAAKEAEKLAKKAEKEAVKEAEKAKKKAEKEAAKKAEKAKKKAEKKAANMTTVVLNNSTEVEHQNEELTEEPISPCDSGEEEEVEAITIGSHVFLRSKSDTLYDATTHSVVGKYVPGENCEEGTIQKE